MGCKRVTKKIFRVMLAGISGNLMGFITETVKIVAETDWGNDEKREIAVALAKAKARQLRDDAKETAIRGAVEVAVTGLQMANDKLSEFQEEDLNQLGTLDVVEDDLVE